MKIVAIGGGNNSNIRKNGAPKVYEHGKIDKEIIRLSGKKKPNVLFVSHASSPEMELPSYKAIVNTYGVMYKCPTELFSIDKLVDYDESCKLVDWADIIYVGGGNTKQLMELWCKSGIAEKMIDICDSDKVLCGTSGGAGCWFKYSCSDYLQMETGNINSPFMPVKGLGLVDLVFNPHASDHGRMRGIKNITELVQENGLSLTDNMAIEIVDDEYKLIEGTSSQGLRREAIISYWKKDDYIIEPVENNGLISELVDCNAKVYRIR